MTKTAQYGIGTPAVTLTGGYGGHSNWEADATPEDFAAIAAAADRLGYAYLACSEHVGIPPEVEAVRGGRYYDPLPFFGYLAGMTTQIRFLTYVLVLAYNHPLEIAKRYGTLDRLSKGRVMLGVGVGSLKPEFDLLGLGGVEFTERGVRGDDAIRAIRASMGQRLPKYSGPFYEFSDFIIDPCAVQQHMPIWIGGRSARSLRRAVELGDGWAPFGLAVPEMQAMIERAKDKPSWDARDKPIELALRHDGLLDPVGEPGLAADRVAAVFEAGATTMHIGFASNSPAHYIEQVEALAVLKI
ncbi:MAG: TIGR03619 family F420-dependent LLM class oxidoreductase [Novosphingobium sp.]|nr:TIGR03619 family F420-dependent LLM class oxidoreductase [Novosphingobium sp.]